MNRVRRLVLLIALLAGAAPARAHDFPTPFRVLFQPNRPERMVVALRPGLALTENGGTHWNFLCGSVFGIAGNDPYALTLTAGGRLLVGAFTGVYRDDGMGCGWSKLGAEGLPAGRVVALSLLDDGAVLALTASATSDNGLYSSRDDGVSWSPHGAPLGAAMPNAMLRAPSDPARLYVTGAKPGETAALLWTTRDGGRTWEEITLAGDQRAELLAVDPLDPERVFLRRVTLDPLLPDAITESADGGRTHRLFYELAEVGGFALGRDGTVWFGSRAGGLFRAERDAAPESIDPTLRVGCLQLEAGTLWVCARDQSGFDPFAVARSDQGGEQLQAAMRSDQLRRLRTCGNPQQATSCRNEWTQWKYDVFGSGDDPPLLPLEAGMGGAGGFAGGEPAGGSGATSPVDAPARAGALSPRAAAPRRRSPGGCAVAADRTEHTVLSSWRWLGLGLLLFQRRARRDRPPPPALSSRR